MRVLQKREGKDFKILNITDPQLSNEEWADGHKHRAILEYTVNELIGRVGPDLITVSGDIAWGGHDRAYDMFASFIDGFGIPWAFVWGNHDHEIENDEEYVDGIATKYMEHPNCIYEKGDPSLGNGNYVILIEENSAPVEAIIMLDTHNRMPYTDPAGETKLHWAKLTSKQEKWIEKEVDKLKKSGCKSATLLMHIPIYAYRFASKAAYKEGIDLKSITPQAAEGLDCWNEGYKESVGVQYEGIESYPEDDGIFETFKKLGIIKHIVAGHDHINDFIITYEGIKMIYALKTGAGCYWDPVLNGGTVLCLNEKGVYDVRQEYVDIRKFL